MPCFLQRWSPPPLPRTSPSAEGQSGATMMTRYDFWIHDLGTMNNSIPSTLCSPWTQHLRRPRQHILFEYKLRTDVSAGGRWHRSITAWQRHSHHILPYSTCFFFDIYATYISACGHNSPASPCVTFFFFFFFLEIPCCGGGFPTRHEYFV